MKYPWDKWLDGELHVITPDEGNFSSIHPAAMKRARKMGGEAKVTRVDGNLHVQFIPEVTKEQRLFIKLVNVADEYINSMQSDGTRLHKIDVMVAGLAENLDDGVTAYASTILPRT